MLAHGSAALTEIPERVVQVYAHGAKVADEERHTVLVAVARKCGGVRNVHRICSGYAGACFLDCFLSSADLGILLPGLFHVLGFRQRLNTCIDLGLEIQLCVQGEAKQIVQLDHVVLDLEIGGEDRLLALEEFCPALQRCDLEGAAVADLVFVNTESFGREGGLLLRRFLLKLRDQNAIIECVHLQCDFILRILQVVLRSGDFRSRDAILLMNAQQLRQRLGDHRAARNERLLALWQRRIDVRNGHTCGAPKGSWRNREVLQFADMQCVRLIGNGWKVIGARNFFAVLALLNLKARDLEGAVLSDCQANRFRKFQVSNFVGQSRTGAKKKYSGGCQYPEKLSASHGIFLKS